LNVSYYWWILIKKAHKLILTISIVLIVVIPITISVIIISNSNTFTNLDVDLHFNGDNAYTYVEDQLNINTTHYRTPGTQGREDVPHISSQNFKKSILR